MRSRTRVLQLVCGIWVAAALPELTPFGERYLTVVFPHRDWKDRSGTYTTDYHAAKPRNRGDAWTFEVRASPGVERVTLRWEGRSGILRRMHLVDEATGKTVPMKPDGRYPFRMTGTRRVFSCHLDGR